MKVSYLALAATLAAIATGALAETGVRMDQTDNVANVYGRASVPKARISVPVLVTRPSEGVRSGSTTVEGPAAVATVTCSPDVNEVHGRS